MKLAGRPAAQKTLVRSRKERRQLMRVYELLSDPVFSGLKLLAGPAGDGNEITAVAVVDTADDAERLGGGELVLTSGAVFDGSERSVLNFMHFLSQRQVAALGIQEGPAFSAAVPAALRLADSIGLPLIALPGDRALSDVANPLLARIVRRQQDELTRAGIIHDRFTDLAVNDRPICEILQVLSQIVGVPCAFVDSYFHRIYHSEENGVLSSQLGDAAADEVTESLLRRFDSFTVSNQSKTFGYVLFPKNALENWDDPAIRMAVEQAQTTLILRMQMRISNKSIEERYKGVFVADLLLNNIKGEQEIHNRAQIYGWNFADGGLVAVVDINNLKKHFSQKLDSGKNRVLEEMGESVFELAIREIHLVFPEAKHMRQSDLIAFLITVPQEARGALEGELRRVFQRIQRQLILITSFTISIGVGSYYENIRDIYKSYVEARTTINLSYALQWFDCILFYEEMGLYRMLTPIMSSPEAMEYCEKYLQPLELYDAENGQELLNTLNEIIQTGWNLKKAAENMYLHYNSMKYRYNRICAIMGLDLSKQANRLMISIALIVHMMNRTQLPDTKRYIPIY